MKTDKKCIICGGDITGDVGHNRKYCSKMCARQAEAKKRMKYIASRANALQNISHRIYKAYNHSCALCGWRATQTQLCANGKHQYSYGNEIHHIVPVSKGGDEQFDNLILLCPNHHKQAGFGVITQSELKKHSLTLKQIEAKELAERTINSCSAAIAAAIWGNEVIT